MNGRAVAAAERLRRLLPAVWLGLMLALGAVVAPSLFALLDRPSAGRVAGRLFAIEAQLSLLLCVVLGLIERARAARLTQGPNGSRFSGELMLILGALFCTVLGHHALQPMLEAARAGQGAWSFATLHAIATGLFGLKAVIVAALAWRVARP